MEALDNFCRKLYLHILDDTPHGKKIHEKTHVKASYFALVLLVIFAFWFVFNNGGRFVIFLAGFLYPCYASYKALETPGLNDDSQWLTYWVIFSFIHVSDKVLDYFFTMIPFHNLVKLVFIVFLYHPRTQGAQLIYEKVIRPILLKYEKDIDGQLKNLHEQAKQKVHEAQPMIGKVTQAAKDEALHQAVNYVASNHGN
eukprot:CAMPEP_0176434292 /NCGR_PEP_ID=MMETSP0127-20121128/16588_1 /TAXON_ID=938130 /ORGANISM="Platyophrya macrostoma, Strain WH" /LENGTH=197 /DNA_ID=CAMNT_0017816997 /DNA_START=35 /DNA_END=628 /DNA_ORIENTATION=-